MSKRLTHIDDVTGSDWRRYLVTALVCACTAVCAYAIYVAASATWEYRRASTVHDAGHGVIALLMIAVPIYAAVRSVRRYGFTILWYVAIASAVMVWLTMCAWMIIAGIDWL